MALICKANISLFNCQQHSWVGSHYSHHILPLPRKPQLAIQNGCKLWHSAYELSDFCPEQDGIDLTQLPPPRNEQWSKQLQWCPWHWTLGKINFRSTQFVSNKIEHQKQSSVQCSKSNTFWLICCGSVNGDHVTRPGGSSHPKCPHMDEHVWKCNGLRNNL